MKSNSSTLQLFGFFRKPAIRIHFTFLFIAFALLSSSASFAGTETMRVNLYLLNSNNTTILADGILTEYNNLYHDSVTLEDAYKFTNINENLGLTRYGHILAVERRPIILTTDTLFLKLWRTTERNYQFEFVTTNLDHPGMQGFLEDAYLGTSSALSLSGTTKLNFSINSNPASGDIYRFKIVYREASVATPLPVNFSFIRTYLLNNKISVEWKVENQINVDRYEVERSSNGVDFNKATTVAAAKINNTVNTYSWIDENPVDGNNFYRIKSVDRDGSIKLSSIVKINKTVKTGASTITIYPNPIQGNIINVRFSNQPAGIYQARLISNTGQLVYSGNLSISGSNISQTLYTSKKLSGGIYQLEIKAPDNTVHIQKAIVQD